MMGFIEIPKIKVRLPIYHGTADETLKMGVGHIEGTSFPVGGPKTHAVLTGHSGLTYARLFTELVELNKGDIFLVRVLDQTLAYEIDQIKVVEPTDTTDLGLYPNEDYVTLVTCTPYGINSHRLLVRGQRTEYVPDSEIFTTEQEMTMEARILFLVGIPTAILMSILILIATFARERKRRQVR
jgi:sortase A